MRVFRSRMMFSFLRTLILILLCDVFGSDDVKSVSVLEGDSVSLNTDVTEVQSEQKIMWTFGPQRTQIARIYKQNIDTDATNTILENRLQMDNQTGSLTVRNIRSEHSGLYELQIYIYRGISVKRFSVSVYALLPVPVITSNSSNCSSSSPSSSSVSRCSLLCSVVNVSAVTLSWYKGNSLLSSISVSDLSISLSLPLEIECLDDSYRCVVAYSFTNRTKHLNNTDLCQPCSDSVHCCGSTEAVIRLVVSALVGVATVAVVVYDITSRRAQ
ncbi:uncharacterized protein LOC127986967 [Carassius gibelio]|uniref:uncharacterized protein LOC127986967 n=1 Tax=Carassius gibelio TaxID=101364 RepID=UPI002277DA80|nr:uncharacterized protein LOC127986967 [Carassius gibelio]